MLNGDGLRVVLWVSGCDHCCKECHNPITWDPNGGLVFDKEAKEELFEEIWGYEYVGDTRTVDVHVKRLREKIKDKPTWRIATVWGIGYKFEVK